MPDLTAAALLPGARVCIADSIAVTAAYLAPETWNGWACPYLDRAAVLDLAAALDAAHAADPDCGLTLLRLDGDTLQGFDTLDGEGWEDWGGPVLIDGVPHWAPGAWGWTWYVIPDDAVVRWHVSPWSHTASAAFYAPDAVADFRGDPIFPTAEAARAHYAATAPAGTRGDVQQEA